MKVDTIESSLQNLEYRVHGVKVHALQPDSAFRQVDAWLQENETNENRFRYVVSTNINNIVCALESSHYREVMETADMSIPDGVPILWIGRHFGHALPSRCGIEELMETLFLYSNINDRYSHFFYGNTEEVLSNLKENLTKKYPDLKIAGMLSPPFHVMTNEEEDAQISIINRSSPDFIWVSLGCPKQEIWLHRNRHKIHRGIGGGAGAVFNFFSGETAKAPHWIRIIGMEWLFRLCFEPSRLWRRYILRYPKFFFYAVSPKKYK